MTAISQASPTLGDAAAYALAEQVIARCRELATITDVEGNTTRTFLSAGMRQANEKVAAWMREAGMAVHMDAVGNLHGILAGSSPGALPFLLASHLDTVPNAGAFDGILGVVIALALANHAGNSLPFPLHIVAFSEEEGVRFGVPFLGSRGLVGELDEPLLARVDREGCSVRQVIEQYGLNPEDIPLAQLPTARGYLEFHIEQGPVLESDGIALASVEAIAGQSRYQLTFRGSSNHAGTTPMRLRHDALCAAAAWVVEVERYATETPSLVATVGSLDMSPNVGNVIAGEVVCSLDVRSADDEIREAAVASLLAAASDEAERRDVQLSTQPRMEQAAVPLDESLLRQLEQAMEDVGVSVRLIVSGAGHDAMIVAPHMPAAMLFLRTPGGLSHHPDEAVAAEDVALALQVGARLLQNLSAEPASPRGTL